MFALCTAVMKKMRTEIVNSGKEKGNEENEK